MKKVSFFISIIGAALLMNSCLGDGNSNYAEQSFVYIAGDGLTTYGRTHTGRFVISSEITRMESGTIQYFYYNWDEDYGTTQVTENYFADNVVISGERVTLPIIYLTGETAPADENPAKFNEISTFFYVDDKVYFGDNWLIPFNCKLKKGESADLEFYLRETPDTNLDATIDIRLVIKGTPESESATSTSGVVPLNISRVRSSVGKTSGEEIKINFHYFAENNGTNEVTSPTYKLTAR